MAHHYDLDGQLYSLFLDADRQYSCAYFEQPDLSLDDAQLAKKRHLAAKLLLEPGRTCSISAAVGAGLALYLAEICGAWSPGSRFRDSNTHAAQVRARESGLIDTSGIPTAGLSDVFGSFDRIVSVGMFEHVGVGYYDAFFRNATSCSTTTASCCCTQSAVSDGPRRHKSLDRKYIFPGGYIPALSEVLPAVERAGLLVTDIEVLSLIMPRRSRPGAQRFLAHREQVEALRPAVCAHVGVLFCSFRNGVSRTEFDGVSNAADEAARHRAHDSRLCCTRGGEATGAGR